MNTFIFTFHADRIAPYTKTVELPALTNDEAGKEFVEGLYSTAFIKSDNDEWVRSTAITSFKVKISDSVISEKEKAAKAIENYLKQNGPAITVESLVHVYEEFRQNMPIPDHVRAAVMSNKNELLILTRKEEI